MHFSSENHSANSFRKPVSTGVRCSAHTHSSSRDPLALLPVFRDAAEKMPGVRVRLAGNGLHTDVEGIVICSRQLA